MLKNKEIKKLTERIKEADSFDADFIEGCNRCYDPIVEAMFHKKPIHFKLLKEADRYPKLDVTNIANQASPETSRGNAVFSNSF